MAFSKSLGSKMVRRIRAILALDEDLFTLCHGEGTPAIPTKAAHIYRGPTMIKEGQISIAPPQINVAVVGGRRQFAPGTGGVAESRYVIGVALFLPLGENSRSLDDDAYDVDDYILKIRQVIYSDGGGDPNLSGRLTDPDDATSKLALVCAGLDDDWREVLGMAMQALILFQFDTREDNYTGARA